MRNEVEIKAHVKTEDVPSLLDALTKQYGNATKIFKSDVYLKDRDGKDVRVRNENGTFIYTKKQQSTENGIEVNKEDERELTEREAEQMLLSLVPFMKKTKQGYVWNTTLGSFTSHIELLEVSGFYLDNKGENKDEKQSEKNLGFFLETELLFEEGANNSTKINEAKAVLLAFYNSLGLENAIESKKYMEMLKNSLAKN